MSRIKSKFSRWEKWDKRRVVLPKHKMACPGIYVLAHLERIKQPSRRARPYTDLRRLIYIGETCGQSLKKRLEQFNRSAFKGKRGHSGGNTYRRTYGRDARKLYLSIFPVDESKKEIGQAFIRYFERKLIWRYASKFGKLPPCNKK